MPLLAKEESNSEKMLDGKLFSERQYENWRDSSSKEKNKNRQR